MNGGASGYSANIAAAMPSGSYTATGPARRAYSRAIASAASGCARALYSTLPPARLSKVWMFSMRGRAGDTSRPPLPPCRRAAPPATFPIVPANSRTRPSRSKASMNRLFRRDRPGSAASITGADVATASEIIETLSIVTTIASARASMPKYGLSPLPSQTWPPSGTSVSASTRVTAGSVRREGVTATPTSSARIIAPSRPASSPATAASSRNRPLLPPTSTATSGRRRCANRGRHASAAAASRAGVARCSAVRVTTTFGPVSSSCRFTTIRSKRRGSMRGCCTCTTGRPPRRSAAPTAAATPPQPITSSGSGARTASRTAASGAGHSDAVTHLHGARGASTRSSGCNPAASARPSACA